MSCGWLGERDEGVTLAQNGGVMATLPHETNRFRQKSQRNGHLPEEATVVGAKLGLLSRLLLGVVHFLLYNVVFRRISGRQNSYSRATGFGTVVIE